MINGDEREHRARELLEKIQNKVCSLIFNIQSYIIIIICFCYYNS